MRQIIPVQYLRTVILILLAIVVISFSAFQLRENEKEVFRFVPEKGEKWYKQSDILAFKMAPNEELPAWKNREQIDKVTKKRISDGRLVKFYLANDTRNTDKKQIANNVLQHTKQTIRLPVLSRSKDKPAKKEDRVIADNRLLVQLASDSKVNRTLEQLANKYQLTLARKGDAVHLLRVDGIRSKQRSIFQVADKLNRDERVEIAYPNRFEMFQSHGDPQLDKSWHVDNKGAAIWCIDGKSGVAGADIKVDDVWNQGYHGQGVKVGVIDFYGFDYGHPDMQGRMIAGYNSIDKKAYNASNSFYTNNEEGHGMAVAGIIGANINNGIGTAGVAPKSKIVPFLVNNSEASIILAIEKAISSDYDVDVINMSFGAKSATTMLHDVVQRATEEGRNGKGCVLVASHGNDGTSDQEQAQYPSAYKEVISVGASTPEDKRKRKGDGWGATGSWGSNYGELLDVVAPGVCILTTDFSGSDGYSSTSDFVGFSRTSAAVPMVSGTAALLLGKNPDLTWQGVRDKIRNSADQVGTYSYKEDGHSYETGYGRINSARALDVKAVGLREGVQTDEFSEPTFTISSPVKQNIRIFIKGQLTNQDRLSVTVLDLSGRVLLQRNFQSGSSTQQYNVEQLPKGMYLAKFRKENGKVVTTKKFVKAR